MKGLLYSSSLLEEALDVLQVAVPLAQQRLDATLGRRQKTL